LAIDLDLDLYRHSSSGKYCFVDEQMKVFSMSCCHQSVEAWDEMSWMSFWALGRAWKKRVLVLLGAVFREQEEIPQNVLVELKRQLRSMIDFSKSHSSLKSTESLRHRRRMLQL
jgi:hypothetical protein